MLTLNHATCAAAMQHKDAAYDGIFFIAVDTTGIFCRPICPAPTPKIDNVRFYASAHEAMAQGYRPCLRCHPDSSPHSYAWQGKTFLVKDVIESISTHPERKLADIAKQLGYSLRHLEMVVKEELGITLKQLQSQQRVLLAKQLLQQTGLSVLDIAQICGYQTERSLQQHFKQRCRLTPSQVRQGRVPYAAQVIELTLPCYAQYDWPRVNAFLQLRCAQLLEAITPNSYIRQVPEGTIEARYDVSKNCFVVCAQLDNWQLLPQYLQQLKRVLGCQTPWVLIKDALLNAGVPAHTMANGLSIAGCWTPFEAMIRAILGQQVSVVAAITKLNQLLSLAQEHLGPINSFVTPQQILQLPLEHIALTQRRRQTIIDVCTYLSIHPHSLNSQSGLASLLMIKGIGPWTVNYVLLRGLGEGDVFLSNDLIIKQQMEKHALDPDQAAPWRSYLCMQLWQWHDNDKTAAKVQAKSRGAS